MFVWYLKKAIRRGRMVMMLPGGRREELGAGPAKDPPLTIRIADRATLRRLSLHPELAFGEAYMDGTLTIENGTIRNVLALMFDNLSDAPPLPHNEFLRPFRPF